MVQEIWNKFNANERMAAIGAIVIIVSWIVGLAGSFGLGGSILALLGAIAVLAIYYLKYNPTSNITWPAPIPLLVLGISAVVALVSVLGVLPWLTSFGVLGSFFGLAFLAVLGTAIGSVIMVWGAWQEYQAMPKTTPPAPPAPPTPPA